MTETDCSTCDQICSQGGPYSLFPGSSMTKRMMLNSVVMRPREKSAERVSLRFKGNWTLKARERGSRVTVGG